MAYTKTTWTNGTTKLNAANMNNIETGIEELKEYVSNMKSNILNAAYPVGSIYLSVSSTDPSSLFGGTWEAWGSGKVPVGINTSDTDFDTVEETGGVKSVTLTSAQCGVPAHAHGLNNHVHGLNSHTHGLNSHKHSLGSHTHSVGTAMAFNPGGTVSRKPLASGRSYHGFASTNVDDLIYGATASAASGNTGAASGSTGAASGNTAAASGNTANNTAANASASHTNLQPYIVCYMWKRTA